MQSRVQNPYRHVERLGGVHESIIDRESAPLKQPRFADAIIAGAELPDPIGIPPREQPGCLPTAMGKNLGKREESSSESYLPPIWLVTLPHGRHRCNTDTSETTTTTPFRPQLTPFFRAESGCFAAFPRYQCCHFDCNGLLLAPRTPWLTPPCLSRRIRICKAGRRRRRWVGCGGI